jgi:hypothetical protein
MRHSKNANTPETKQNWIFFRGENRDNFATKLRSKSISSELPSGRTDGAKGEKCGPTVGESGVRVDRRETTRLINF